VFLSEKDIELLMTRLQMDYAGFVKTWCRWVPRQQGECLSLKEKSNYDCIFWDGGCTMYHVRPLQCRTFPFWEQIVESANAWETAGAGCPGINTGVLHTREAINACIAMRAAQPPIEKKTARGI
jgi:Fe-S-cluster containining protein